MTEWALALRSARAARAQRLKNNRMSKIIYRSIAHDRDGYEPAESLFRAYVEQGTEPRALRAGDTLAL